MRKQDRRNSCRKSLPDWIVAMALALAGVVCSLLPAFAQIEPTTPGPEEEQDSVAAIEKLLQEERQTGFTYQREGRPDPFFPFLTQQIKQAEAAARDELTGMRRFEPGQLQLVAIVQTAKGAVAMVEDSAGVGYILRRGTPIGRAGEVVDIIANKVIIQQEAYSLTKEKEYRTVEMVLTKDGDKKP